MDNKKLEIKYWHVVLLGIGILFLAYILIYIADFKNLFNLRSLYAHTFIPILWNRLFTEGGPIEITQWIFLGLLSIVSAYTAGRLQEKGDKKAYIFWILFAIAGILMLMEDAGDVRDYIFSEQLMLSFRNLRIAETIYFAIISLIPIFAVLKYGKYIYKKNKITMILLALGFLFYGTSVFISGPADLIDGGWYIGGLMYDFTTSRWMGGEELEQIYIETDRVLKEDNPHNLNVTYRLKDFLLEESLELLGATMLLASAVSYLEFINKEKRQKQ